MTAAPRLTRKLLLEEATRVADGAGGFIDSWSGLGILWADIKPGTGREKAGDFTTLSTVPYRVTVRGAPFGAASRPKPDQRFRDGDRIFRILAVTESDASARHLVCFAHEEVQA